MAGEPKEPTSTTPVPDPTLLTTQQLIRENVWLRQVLETRLDGMDKAIELLQSTADKFPQRIDEKIASLAGIHEEKFTSIQKQFAERDVRAEGTSRDAKTAVDAALQAAKEAVGKSETGTLKAIDSLAAQQQLGTKATDEKIADVKERVTRIEAAGLGAASSRTSSKDNLALIIAGVSVVVALVLGSGVLNRQPPPAPPVIIQSPVPPNAIGGGTVTDSRSITKGVAP